MTKIQKEIVVRLLAGASIAGNRLRDANHNPIMKISPRTFYWLKRDVLRKLPSGSFVANKSKIRQMHGNAWIKKTYKEVNAKGNI
jgi:hypothetical protein